MCLYSLVLGPLSQCCAQLRSIPFQLPPALTPDDSLELEAEDCAHRTDCPHDQCQYLRMQEGVEFRWIQGESLRFVGVVLGARVMRRPLSSERGVYIGLNVF